MSSTQLHFLMAKTILCPVQTKWGGSDKTLTVPNSKLFQNGHT